MERGDYETSRHLRDDEMAKRELAIQALGVVDMPTFPDVYVDNDEEIC